ncbi:MAG: type II toxin-antitoxin system death-on-curing family toxin [Deltaproteobacteria bacterium]|nr:type II toxin-antitoxin system death-on-curing family toxin [Deltaproteobacteria bacterium]
MQPVFLTIDEIISIHADQIERYGGSHGIRDRGLLESAVAQPQAGFGDQYLHEDLAAMAAAYLFHIVENHPFVDGNKRVGAASVSVFLLMNDVALTASEEAYYDLVIAVAQGAMSKAQAADFIRNNIAPR